MIAPRGWQAAFLARHAAHSGKDFLLVATPGAGKTLAACQAMRGAGQIVVVCPTTALRSQWADAADRVGLHLDPRWRNADGAWRSDVDGVVVTYQQVASAPDLFAHHLARPTFVVLDEIHHAGESATLGHRAARGLRRRRAPAGAVGHAVSARTRARSRSCATTTSAAARPTSSTATPTRCNDDVCRPLAFRLLDATLRWRVDAQETIAAFADELDATDDARRLRTAIDPRTPLLPQMLRDADALLVKARAVIPDAAGLVLCDDRAHARATATLLRTIAGEKPVVVVSDEPQAHTRIDRFARGGADAPRWLVAVNMVSEGVDVPRLVVAAYATVKRTDLFFRQAVGRVVRRRPEDPGDLVATVFLPADPTLTGCAERVEVELRQQVTDELAAFDAEPPPGLARRPDFQPLDAQVEPGGMIVAGVHYARAEVDAARRLLRELGQSERALRSVLEFVRRERVGGPPPPPTPVPAHRRVEHKRRALDRLARRWAQLRREIDPAYSWPQAQARVNRAMGVRRRADAGEAELDAGLDFLRRELTKLARDYPEQAERLRIPGSVEGIDQRLGAATGDH